MMHGSRSRLLLSVATAALFVSACDEGTRSVPGNDDASGTDAGNTLDGDNTADGSIDVSNRTGDSSVEAGPPPMLASGVAGTQCATDSDCPTGGTCAMQIDLAGPLGKLTGGGSMPTPAPGGYCTTSCTGDAQCGSGGACIGQVSRLAIRGTCEKTCTQDSDCRSGYRCAGPLTVDAGGADAAGAKDPLAMLTMMAPAPPACAPIPMTALLPANTAGKACSADGDCGTQGTCLSTPATAGPFDVIYPGGYCSGNCLQDSDCGTGGRCVQPAIGQGAGKCDQECTADGDCRGGYRCRDQGQGFSACVPGDPKVPNGQVGQACTVTDAGTGPADAGPTPARTVARIA